MYRRRKMALSRFASFSIVEIDVLSVEEIARLATRRLRVLDEFNYRRLSSHYLQIIATAS